MGKLSPWAVERPDDVVVVAICLNAVGVQRFDSASVWSTSLSPIIRPSIICHCLSYAGSGGQAGGWSLHWARDR